MKVIFMGSPQFAVESLKALHEAGHEIVCVVSQKDKPRGRKKIMTPTEVKSYALGLGLNCITPDKIRDSEVINYLGNFKADIIVVTAYGKILPNEILGMCPYGAINVHASLLPKFRGASPIQSSIISGSTETGVTIMYMAEELDAGDMLAVDNMIIGENDIYGDIHDKLAVMGGNLLIDTIVKIEKGEIIPVPQDHEKATFTHLLTRDDEVINWDNHVIDIHNRIRGLSPAPLAHTIYNDAPMKIADTKVELTDISHELGTVVEVNNKIGIKIACNGGYLWIGKLQPAGKKLINAVDYYRGVKDKNLFRLF